MEVYIFVLVPQQKKVGSLSLFQYKQISVYIFAKLTTFAEWGSDIYKFILGNCVKLRRTV